MVSEHAKLTDITLCLEMSPPLKIHLCSIFRSYRTIIVTNSNSQVPTQNMLEIIAGGPNKRWRVGKLLKKLISGGGRGMAIRHKE